MAALKNLLLPSVFRKFKDGYLLKKPNLLNRKAHPAMKKFLLFLFLLPAICFGQAPVANFTADVTTGCAPLVVQFTSTSANVGSGASYDWNFGNGATSVLQNPSTTFLQPGQYTVSLTVRNASGSNTKTATAYITVRPSPTVSWSVNNATGCPPHRAVFTNTSTLNAPGTATYLWSFGNGATDTQPTSAQVFSTPGSYAASLRVTNSYGCIATKSVAGQIVVHPKPTAGFTAGNTSFCKTGNNSVQFSGTASGGQPPYTYSWNFGDGNSGSGASPSHTYNGAGPFAVRLVVTDSRGCSDTLLRPGFVTTVTPSAAFTTLTPTGCAGAALRFTDVSTPASTSVYWDFGSAASPSTGTLPVMFPVFGTAGTYSVMMVSTVNGCRDTVRQNVTIVPAPTASFTNTPEMPCTPPALISYSATAPAGSTYQWRFGDGGTATGASPTHNFTQYGIYTDTLIVTAPGGCRNTVIRSGNVGIYNKQPNMSASPTKGCVPLTVKFRDSLTTTTTTMPFPVVDPYPSPVVSWNWDFRDGNTSTLAQPSHTFTDTGKFQVLVTMTTANGCVVKDSVLIEVGQIPQASFTYTPTTACVRKSVFFNNTSTGAQTYEWSFGDGGNSGAKNPTYSYSAPGSFVVILSAFHNGCIDTARSAPITIRPPRADFAPAFSCDTPLKVRFVDGSVGAQTYSWNFGDGGTATTSSPVHTYATASIYNVRLIVSNATTGCTDTLLKPVDLTTSGLSVVANDTTICKGDTVIFSGNYTGGGVQEWKWYNSSPGGWVQDTARRATMRRGYGAAGRWGVKLVIKNDKGCKDSVVKSNYILVSKPAARMVASDSAGCVPLGVTFTDSSLATPGTSLVSRNWTFGNGQTLQTGSPTANATYTSRGYYNVTLVVTDNIGCTDTISKPAFIRAARPIADFDVQDTNVCPGSAVSFVNRSTSTLFSSAHWSFGDGDTSNAFYPSHIYRAPGLYTVRMILTDSLGCKDTLTKTNYINAVRPQAAFTASDTQTVCPPPFVVTFTNNSLRATSFRWDYGNGTTATSRNGGTSYLTPGIYTVTLIASDSRGCSDTTRRIIRVLGYAGAISYQPLAGCAPLPVTMTTNLRNLPSVIWDFGDGVTRADTASSVTHVYQTPGAYVPKIIVSNGAGCSASSQGSDTLKVDKIEAGFATGPACDGQPVQFTDTSRSLFSVATAWQWSFPGGGAETTSNPVRTLGIPGNYTVRLIVTNANGCKDTITRMVPVNNNPTISAGPDTAVCPGSFVVLSAGGGVQYSWSPATGLNDPLAARPQASPLSATLYTVRGTDSNGCASTDSVWVRMKTHTTGQATGDVSTCFGTPVELWSKGGTRYEWLPPAGLNDPTSATPTAKPDTTTRYMVIIQDGRCVPDSHYVAVTINYAPKVNAGPDVGIVSGSSTTLNAQVSGAAGVTWSPAEGLSCTSCPAPQASPSRTIKYTVKAISDAGCELEDDVVVFVDCKEGQLFVPNTFSPNGDGENDVFVIHGNGIAQIKSLRIYNRWGGLVFYKESFVPNDKAAGWDGTQGGEKLAPDAFVYVMEVVCNTGQSLTFKGDVTLIR